MMNPKTKRQARIRRHARVRTKVAGTAERPRLVVYRSLKHMYAQLVDDEAGRVLCGAGDCAKSFAPEGAGKVGRSIAVGKALADKAKAMGITTAVFDRAGYPYHGRVRAVAEGARAGGLEF